MAASKPDRFSLPASNELEVSVFGPGRGECVVVHVPDGPWFVVDSCLVRVGKKNVPVAVAYLRDGLGVTELDAVFITHWHDDHTRGAAELIRVFSSSLRLVGLPPGFGTRELASFVADIVPLSTVSKMVGDLLEVVSVLHMSDFDTGAPVLLNQRQQLAPLDATWSLTALSPSYEDLRHQAATLMAWSPQLKGRGPRAFDVNSGCAVLFLQAAGLKVLLASDLDEGDDVRRGWRCVTNLYGSHLESHILKVGHHGSATAFHLPAIQAISPTGHARGVVTPFPARGAPLPRSSDLKRYRPHLHSLHVTGISKIKKSAGNVAMKLTPFTAYVPTSPLPLENIGQVRYRWTPGDSAPTVDLFPPAHQRWSTPV